MSVSKSLTKDVKGIALMVVIIVVMSIVLIKFKDISGVTSGLNTSIDNTVTALGTPVTWISIVIIVIVIAWVLKYFQGKNKGAGL
jgi:hypothetical protein